MKRAILISFVTCLAFTNLSFMGMPMTQANAQWSTISSIISWVSSWFSSSSSSDTSNNKPYKTPVYSGNKDCSDELWYYYTKSVNAMGQEVTTKVGERRRVKGDWQNDPPAVYDYGTRVSYTPRTGMYSWCECSGTETSTPCTNHAMSCEEQVK